MHLKFSTMRKCDAANGSADARFNDSTDEPASPSQARPFSSRDRGENPPTVFLLVWTGTADQAMEVVRYHYANYKIVLLSHRKLREGGWKGQVRALRDLRGEALVFFFQSLGDLHEPLLLAWSGLLHHCRETAFAESSGRLQRFRRFDWLRLFPKTVFAALADGMTFALSWILLQLGRWAKPKPMSRPAAGNFDLDVAYLYPYPWHRPGPGGAMSHIRGFLGGLVEQDVRCEVFSGGPLPIQEFPSDVIPSTRQFFLFWEAAMLAYNLRFAAQVRRCLAVRRVRTFYQRHGRFVVAGALLSHWMRIPLILEYNGSEIWMAKHWDPSRFAGWLRLCEEFSLASASLIVVVSDPLRDELLRRGVPENRILVNPNAVDPARFQPNCGGRELRAELRMAPDDMVITFVGTFSYWHGVPVLQEAILRLFGEREQIALKSRLRFLLVGDGPFRAEMRQALREQERTGAVVFTGLVPHDRVASYLDASDIVVSPHLPLSDGRPFFGSPTKLFEYMAMSKGIIASNLDQLAQVLEHGETAWLVPPGNPAELASAIELLAQDPDLRRRLGRNARAAALARHTWRQNAERVLSRSKCSPVRNFAPAGSKAETKKA